MKRCLALALAFAVGAATMARGGVERERLSAGWEFMRADGSASETNSAAWRAVRVPHDWGVEKPFDPKKPYGDAYLEPTGIGWYRRTFRLDPARAALVKAGGRVFFESNGMMSHSKIWVNGAYVGGWPYGYTAFRCDLTPHLNPGGGNTLVVRCHNHVDSSRWYTGGGMYRECRLAYCPADYLVPGSVAITTPEVSKEKATVHVEWEMSKSGKKERTFTVESPRLWDIDDPHLYSLEIEGETFRYGIRTIAFHPDARGFQLNGRRVELKGVCLHHELGVLGAAYNRAAMKRRFLKLKEAGVNAIRCSHNPEDPDFLDLCDELGLLVKNEVFDEWRRIGVAGKRKDGYTKLFDEWHERDVRAWVRADRNHPSVIMWSIGNEIPEGYAHIAPTSEFIATAKALDAIVKSEDRTRPVTNANNNRANATNEYGRVLDIYGFNYSCYMFGPFKKKNPDKPFFGSETQCALSSRGVYTFPVKWGWTQEKTGSLHVSGYGVEACGWSGNPNNGWACAPDAQWFNMDAHPECMGEFVWTGWDYLGGPYWADKMVKKFKIKGIHSCATGFFDLAGFPKDTFWLFQSRWRPDLPMAHIVPHWNLPDRVGKVTPVHVFTSGDEGELFLNGRSLGRRKKDPKDWKKAYRLVWDDVVYEPGTLKVVAYKNGAPWAEESVSTAGPAAKLKLEVEDLAEADADLAFVNLEVQDAEGRFVPDASVEVAFSVKGPGELVATDNGDEADFDSFHSPVRRTFSGRLQAIVRKAPCASGKIEVEATAPSLACPSATCTVFAVTCANSATVADENAGQVNEAAAVFEGKIPAKMRGGTWKVVYSSAEGPEGRALEVLTERIGQHLLRDGHLATSMVLPLEKDGGEKVETKRDVVVIGRPSQNATLRKCLKGEDAPKGGYLVKSMHENGRNVVLLVGDTPEAVLWAAFDFLDVVAPTLEAKMSGMHGRYVGTFFRGGEIPAFECRRVPQTPVRSVFSWGHVVDDYRASFREMARARFNRAILWNDQLVVNAREVVECARSWGVRVYWGFSWGWTLSGNDGKDLDFGKLADDIVDEWRRKWKPMGGDGIYFQSFTETDKREIGGRSIPEAVTELVNAVSARIHAEAPDVDIVFGLHSNSMKREGAEEAIAKVDPSLEILWENCGGFPFWEAEGKESSPDVAFCDRILALNPSVGLAWKAQLRIDWGNYVPPAGPFVLGCAGERLRDRDRSVTAPRQWSFDEDWILNGANAHEFVRHVRAGKRPPKEFNAVAEYNPPYSFATHCQAELFWNSDDDWEEIAKRARLRARPER